MIGLFYSNRQGDLCGTLGGLEKFGSTPYPSISEQYKTTTRLL